MTMTLHDRSAREGAATARPATAPRARRRVMLVEDEPRLREMLTRAVTEMGFDVASAATGEAALRHLGERPADVVVLDLNLPGMNGMELFEAIRKSAPATQVIVLTGFGDLGAAQKAIHLDAVDFLTKPCALGDLEVALARAWSRRSSGSVRGAAGEEGPAAAPPPPQAITSAPIAATSQPPTSPPVVAPSVASTEARVKGAADNSLEAIERAHILAVLEKNHGNRGATAAELGISLRKLYYRLGQYQREGLMP